MNEEHDSWYLGVSPELVKQLLRDLEAELKSRKLTATIYEEEGFFEVAELPNRRMGLTNLAQQYAELEPENRLERIRDHLERVLVADPSLDSMTLQDAMPLLRVRYSDEMELDRLLIVSESIAEDLTAFLAVDRHDRISYVTPSDLERWGASASDLFARARRNVQDSVEARRQLGLLKDGSRLILIAGDDCFTASLAFDPQANLPAEEQGHPEPPRGYFIAFPNRHIAFIGDPIGDEWVSLAETIRFASRNQYRQGPGSWSDDVYWVRRGRWIRLKFDHDGHLTQPTSLD